MSHRFGLVVALAAAVCLAVSVVCSNRPAVGKETDRDADPGDADPGDADPGDADLGEEEQQQLADAVYTLFDAKCQGCHQPGGSGPFDIRDYKALIARNYAIPGRAEESGIFDRITKDDGHDELMPQGGPRLDQASIDLVARWMNKAGARKWSVIPPRQFVSRQSLFEAMADFLQALPAERQARTRFFSLAHLHNNDDSFHTDDLRFACAAVSKLLNSLSWQESVRTPELLPVQGDETPGDEMPQFVLLAIDLADFGWTAKDWDRIVRNDPYGLTFADADDAVLKKLARKVYQQTETPLPFVRADWFVFEASRSPLYDELLRLPGTATLLEHKLGVDVESNLTNAMDDEGVLQGAEAGKYVIRAAVPSGATTYNNRLVERHEPDPGYGYYWKSYDFPALGRKTRLDLYPLGPTFPLNPYAERAFECGGGEIIFGLPNGLQGYMIVDAKGQAIPDAPVNLLKDLGGISGIAPALVNGISCMACHREGLNSVSKRYRSWEKEIVRERLGVLDDAEQLAAKQMYVEPDKFKLAADNDSRRFIESLAKTAAPYFDQSGAKLERRLVEDEPIRRTVTLFLSPLSPQDIAAELGQAVPSIDIASTLAGSRKLQRIVAAADAARWTIRRLDWQHAYEGELSPYQVLAGELKAGQPYQHDAHHVTSDVHTVVRDLADRVAPTLKDAYRQATYAQLEVTASDRGPAFAEAGAWFAERLAAQGVSRADESKFKIVLSFKLTEEARATAPQALPLVLRVSATVQDKITGAPAWTTHFERMVEAEAAVLAALGPSYQVVDPKESGVAQDARVLAQLRGSASPHVRDGTAAYASDEGKVGIQLLVKRGADANFQPLVLQPDGYAALERNEVYQLELINDSAYDMAVFPYVDGLSLFNFSGRNALRNAGKSIPQYVVVPAGKRRLIEGWYSVDDKLREFQVGSRTDAHGEKPQRGTITATFATCWERDKDRPDIAKTGLLGGDPSFMTRPGVLREAREPFTRVDYHVGRVFGVVTVPYGAKRTE